MYNSSGATDTALGRSEAVLLTRCCTMCSGLTINILHQQALPGVCGIPRTNATPPLECYAMLMHLFITTAIMCKNRRRRYVGSADLIWVGGHSSVARVICEHGSAQLTQVQPMPSKIAFVSFNGIPLTPNARTCVPLLNRCRPTATFHPSSSGRMKTYRLPS